MSGIKYLVVAILAGLFLYVWLFDNKRTCRFPSQKALTIGSAKEEQFSEYIPQTGIFFRDTISNISYVKVEIDQMYLPRITVGLKATTEISDTTYAMKITHINTTIVSGRFTVDMNFIQDVPSGIENGKRLRLRLELTAPRNALLIPVGGFYKDSGGKWVYVVNGDRAVKRNVKLGKHNPNYIEVLEGLNPGDQVITSPYEEFKNLDSLDLKEIKKRFYSN